MLFQVVDAQKTRCFGIAPFCRTSAVGGLEPKDQRFCCPLTDEQTTMYMGNVYCVLTVSPFAIYTCIYICICMYIYIYIYVYMCMYIYIYMYMYIYIYMCVYIYNYINYMCIYIVICVYIYMIMYVCMYACMHACMNVM